MFSKCCKCRQEKVDEGEETTTVLIVSEVPEDTKIHAVSDVSPATPLSKESLKVKTLRLWRRGQSGIPLSAFVNADLSTTFKCVIKITSRLMISVTRIVEANLPVHTTVLEFPLQDVSAFYEGPCLRTPSKIISDDGDGLGVGTATPNEEVLNHTLQMVYAKPVGPVHSLCLITSGPKERRDMFAALSVLRCISVKRATKNMRQRKRTGDSTSVGRLTNRSSQETASIAPPPMLAAQREPDDNRTSTESVASSQSVESTPLPTAPANATAPEPVTLTDDLPTMPSYSEPVPLDSPPPSSNQAFVAFAETARSATDTTTEGQDEISSSEAYSTVSDEAPLLSIKQAA